MSHQTALLGDGGKSKYPCPEEKSGLHITVSTVEGSVSHFLPLTENTSLCACAQHPYSVCRVVYIEHGVFAQKVGVCREELRARSRPLVLQLVGAMLLRGLLPSPLFLSAGGSITSSNLREFLCA